MWHVCGFFQYLVKIQNEFQVNSQQFFGITEATSPSAGSGDVLGGRFLQEF